jgi:hypothetical protein
MGRQILGILGEVLTDRVVHQVRDGLSRYRGLRSKGSMQVGVEIDRGSFRSSHVGTIAS